MPFFVYILRCADDSYYVGHTDFGLAALALRSERVNELAKSGKPFSPSVGPAQRGRSRGPKRPTTRRPSTALRALRALRYARGERFGAHHRFVHRLSG